MRLALLGPRVRRTLYKQDRAEDEEENSICGENNDEKTVEDVQKVIENSQNSPENENKSASTLTSVENSKNRVKSVAESVEGATTETPETEVEPLAEASNNGSCVVIAEKASSSSSAQKTENLKIKSKVSIILREPKCPSQLNNGFSQIRTTCQ
jgi:flagellar motility protein MotE (MotC chaperone)